MFGYRNMRLRILPPWQVFWDHIQAFAEEKKLPRPAEHAAHKLYGQMGEKFAKFHDKDTFPMSLVERFSAALEPLGWTFHPYNWFRVFIDETRYWNLDLFDLPKDVAREHLRLGTTYLFDLGTMVHICSTVPNYEFWPENHGYLYTAGELSDEAREALDDTLTCAPIGAVSYMSTGTLAQWGGAEGLAKLAVGKHWETPYNGLVERIGDLKPEMFDDELFDNDGDVNTSRLVDKLFEYLAGSPLV